MLVQELRQLLAVAQASSAVLVFIRRPGALEPEIVEVVDVLDLCSEDAFVLFVGAAGSSVEGSDPQ
jgi:hypothetical protein